MIKTALKNKAAFRAHTPKWAVAPTSGTGAGQHGGRVNRIGVDALYLSLDEVTAIAEYKQLGPLLPPATMVSYLVTVDSIADFTAGFDPKEWNELWQDFYCDWREIWFNQRVEPPSWVLGDQLITAGYKGLLFKSCLVSGVNLVLFTGQLTTIDQIQVYDPNGALPKNQDSWQ